MKFNLLLVNKGCPEQYKVYDVSGKLLCYISLRYGILTCSASEDIDSSLVYSIQKYQDPYKGTFDSKEERDEAIKICLNDYYSYIVNDYDIRFDVFDSPEQLSDAGGIRDE